MTTGATDTEKRAHLLARVERDEADLHAALDDVRRLARESVAVTERAGSHIGAHPIHWVVGSGLVGLWVGTRRNRKETHMEFAKDLTRNLPSGDDIMRAFGGQFRHRSATSETFSSLALFGAGLLVGAGLALLFAPREGRRLREEISERASHLKERVASGAQQAQESLQQYGQSGQQQGTRQHGESQYGKSGQYGQTGAR